VIVEMKLAPQAIDAKEVVLQAIDETTIDETTIDETTIVEATTVP
jgi:hypothetical protein